MGDAEADFAVDGGITPWTASWSATRLSTLASWCPMPALTFDRISAARPDGTILFSDLSFSLGRECAGLVRRNGSGKSTLLAIAAGLAPPAAGEVVRDGRVAFLRQVQPSAGTVAEALGQRETLAAIARLEAGAGTAEDAALADWELAERIEAAALSISFAALSRALPAFFPPSSTAWPADFPPCESCELISPQRRSAALFASSEPVNGPTRKLLPMEKRGS